ncbi:MAG: helix-turn-helix domain-containing protein [Collinsella sp.]
MLIDLGFLKLRGKSKRVCNLILRGNETSDTRAYEQALDIEYIVHREMQRSGLSKSELTKRMGVSLQSLSKLLNSQPNMTLKTVTKFELALGIKIIPQVISGYSNEAPFFLSNAISMAYGHARDI